MRRHSRLTPGNSRRGNRGNLDPYFSNDRLDGSTDLGTATLRRAYVIEW